MACTYLNIYIYVDRYGDIDIGMNIDIEWYR